MKKLIFVPFLLFVLISSCKKDNTPPAIPVTPVMARDSLFDIMNEWYYWYNLMPGVNKTEYSDPYQLMEAMRYKPVDRWSFVADYDEFMAEMGGTFVGHGFRIGLDDSDNARIAMIYLNSPLYAQGVRRGWIVKTINGTALAPILISRDDEAYSNLLGPGEAGRTNIFVFQKPDGTEITITSTKSVFQVNSVLLYDTLHLTGGAVVGQLVFESFISPSETEFLTAFSYFKANNITDLILDLRYNSGGYLSVAKSLASYIAGDAHQGDVFAKLKYNNKHPEQNSNYLFRATSYPLALPRVVVITSRLTASASEAVMNGLKPFVNIISIGDTTNGKPTGMNGWEVGLKYIFYPVTFEMVNSQDQGGYFAGIYPDILLTDDLTHDFNDRRETCLAAAIHYLETGSIPSKGATNYRRSYQFSEKPSWMNNTFIFDK